MSKAVTVRELAAMVGVHFTTAALALRNSPKVSAATRRHIQAMAQKLGYRPNPLISALMAQRRATRPTPACVLAYITMRSRPADYADLPHEWEFAAGAKLRAEQLGYKLESFCLFAPGMTSARLAQILHARGIPGLVIGPSVLSHTHLPRALHSFASVTLGYSLLRPRLHRVTHNHAAGIQLACRELRRRGCRRIGLVLTGLMDRHVDRLWSAGYLVFHQSLPTSDRVPPLYLPGEAVSDPVMRRWIGQRKPDAIVTVNIEVLHWLKENASSIGWNILLTGLDLSPAWGNCAGVLQKPRKLGAAAIDLLTGQLHRNEQGLPDEPITVMIEGEWQD